MTTTMTIDPALLARLARLRALADGSDNANEALAAKRALEATLAKHGLSELHLEPAGGATSPVVYRIAEAPLVEGAMADDAWPVKLASIVAAHHGCVVVPSRRTRRARKLVLRVYGTDDACNAARSTYGKEFAAIAKAVEAGGGFLETLLFGNDAARVATKRLALVASRLRAHQELGAVEAAWEAR